MSDNGYGQGIADGGVEREFHAGDMVGRSTVLYILDRGDVAMRCNVCCTVYDTTVEALRRGKTDTCGGCKPYESGLRNRKPDKPLKPVRMERGVKPEKQERGAAPARRYNYAGTGLTRKQIADKFKVSTTLVDLRQKAYMESSERAAGVAFLDYLAANLYKSRNEGYRPRENVYGTGKTIEELAEQFQYGTRHISTMHTRYVHAGQKYGTFLEYLEHCYRERIRRSEERLRQAEEQSGAG